MGIDTCSQEKLNEFETIGCAVLDEYMEAFNTGDTAKWARVLHFPHVRIAGEKVLVWKTMDEFTAARDNSFAHLEKRINWGYNKWDWRRLVQSSPEKLHYTVQISRHSVNDLLISSFESLYIITCINGHWAVQGRSSYGGIFFGDSGY